MYKLKCCLHNLLHVRSTALEDIYRHYARPQNRDEDSSADEHDTDDEEDYSNHLVGYAYAQQPVAPSKLGYGESGGGYYSGGVGGGYHYPSVDTSHTGTTGQTAHGGYSYSGYGGGYGTTGVAGYTGGGEWFSSMLVYKNRNRNE